MLDSRITIPEHIMLLHKDLENMAGEDIELSLLVDILLNVVELNIDNLITVLHRAYGIEVTIEFIQLLEFYIPILRYVISDLYIILGIDGPVTTTINDSEMIIKDMHVKRAAYSR